MHPVRWTAVSTGCSLLFTVVAASASATPFALFWTAPGDDSLTGQASFYDLRYSSTPITAANFHLATQLVGIPAPAVAGTAETFVVSGLPDANPVYLALKSADERGNWSGISNAVTLPAQTADAGDTGITVSFSSPWPNPARQSVRWAYALPQAAPLQVEILDISGRRVRTVASGDRAAGRGEVSWDLRDASGRRVSTGMYIVRARLGTTEWTKRLVVVR